MESFFSFMKTERIARKVYSPQAYARADVFEYIEMFYNPVRWHSTLEYVSPVKFEAVQFAWVDVHEIGSSPDFVSLLSLESADSRVATRLFSVTMSP